MTLDARVLYQTMVLCRAFERSLVAHATKDGVRIGHPYEGQEAVAAGVCGALRPDDRVTSTHRSHGHAVAKGCDLTGLALELYGKADGLSGGRGGEMNVSQFDIGFMGATDIVGGNLATAAGLALAAQLDRSDRVTVAFVGDGGTNQGVFSEVLNIAAVWSLPLIVVCENNGYAESTPAEYAIGGAGLVARGAAFGLPAQAVDGQDVVAVHEATLSAVERARSGAGASFIEARTYRYFGHYYGDRERRYRPALESARWRARDPIVLARAALIDAGLLDDDQDAEIRQEAQARSDQAFSCARNGPPPDRAALLHGVFADEAVSQ